MVRRIQGGVISLFAFFFAANALWANSLGTSARQLGKGAWKSVFYFQGTNDQHLKFNVGSGGACTPGNQVIANPTFACGGDAKISGEGSGQAFLAKLIYQPNESGFQYYLTAGAGNYSLKVDSVTVVNTLTGDRPGAIYGAGVKAVLWPDTVVTPAIAVDASVGMQRYFFRELRPAFTAAQGQINERLDILSYQVAVELSHLFKFHDERISLEPYGGVKWLRSRAWLKDLVSGQRHSGIQDTVTPFIGLNLPVFEKESLFAEASFVNGVQYAAGLNLRFM